MKTTGLIIGMLLFVTACSSYNHEEYIAKFKKNVDLELNTFSFSKIDSIHFSKSKHVDLEKKRAERIDMDKFYAGNYSWYQLGRNLMLTPADAKQEANKYGFERPYYFLEFLKCDSVQNPVKEEVLLEVKKRLFYKFDQDSIYQFGDSADDLFSAVKWHTKTRYSAFIKVNFESVNIASDKQKKVAAQMTYTALKRLIGETIIKDNLYHIEISSGEEIGISEDLFKIGKGMLNDTNEGFIEKRKTEPKFASDLSIDDTRFTKLNWESAYSLFGKYCK